MIEAVRHMGVIKHFPGRSESDLYMWLIRHQAALREQHDLKQVKLPEAVEEFLQSIEASTGETGQ
jgi:hypothetical protein